VKGIRSDIEEMPTMSLLLNFLPWLAVMAGSRLVAHLAGRPALGTVINVVAIVLAVKFTKSYPDRAVSAATGSPTQQPATASR